ncbi:MAG: hypothetical protein H6705_15870 [Myxococcales bacterium]|nr:hypothetical protein [Myxococcales bacterium]
MPTSPRSCALALALAVGGCSTVTHHHIAGPTQAPAAESAEGEATPAPERRRVLLIVAEGLRRAVLADYFETLEEADFDPDWPSGLAALRQAGFTFARSDRAEASVPGGGLSAAATWATGEWPGQHGIVGGVFHAARPDGYLARYGFDGPVDGSRIFYGPGLAWPTPEAPALAGALVGGPTWAARLGATHRVAVVFAPFGQGAEWLVPEPAEVGAASLLTTPYAAAAWPLVDREVRDGAFEMLLDDDVDVVVAWFRGVGVESCVQPPAECRDDGEEGVAGLQRTALRELDERLGDLLRRYEIARPGGLDGLSVLLVGTGSGVDRGPEQAEKVIAGPTLLARIAEQAADDGCRARLEAAVAAGDLVVAADGGAVARVTVRPGPAGQQQRMRQDLACLGAAVDTLVAETPWLAGAARLPAEALGKGGPRAGRFVVRLRPAFEKQLSARRRSRLVARIRRAVDEPGADGTIRGGHAVLFASAGWVFTDPLWGGPASDLAAGALEEASMAVPFVVADRALSDVADAALRATPVELADVGPTVLAMVEAPAAAFEGLPRPPVVRWRLLPRRVLEHVRADRRIRMPAADPLPVVTWSETGESVTLGLEEPADLWPADVVALRLGEAVFRWDPDANAFPPGLPCQYAEVDKRRTWQCTAAVDRSAPGLMTAAVRRAPSADPARSGPRDELFPVVLGEAAPVVEAVEAVCATAGAVRVRLRAQDAVGLGRVELFVADDRLGGVGRIPGGLLAEAALGGVAAAEACAGDPLAEGCALTATAPAVDGAVEVPFAAAWVAHHRVARALPGVEGVDRAALAAAWAAAGGAGAAPERAFVATRVCNLAGRCAQRALLSDVDLGALVARGCP